MKTILLRRPKRVRLVWIGIIALASLSISPFLIGIFMMTLTGGSSLNESNSVWGVLPWLSFYTIAFFGPPLSLLIFGSIVCVIRDRMALAKGDFNDEEINGYSDFENDQDSNPQAPKEDYNDFTL